MKKKLKGIWQIAWRFLVALLIILVRRTKVIDKKVEYIGNPAVFGGMQPLSVRVEYKTKIRWYSPVVLILIILAGIHYLWDGGLKEFVYDYNDVFSWSEEKWVSWTYNDDFVASNTRVKFDVWLITIIENI